MITQIDRTIYDCTLSDLEPANFRTVFEYWDEARGGNIAPLTDSIRPEKLPKKALPFIGVMSMDDDPRRFFIRVSGSGVTESTGVEFTGMYVDTVPGTESAIERFSWCADEIKPYFVEGPITWSPKDFMHYRVLGLPFINADGEIERVMLVFDFS